MLARQMLRSSGAVTPAPGGVRALTQLQVAAINGDNQAITVAAIIAGIVRRTGTTANTADTLPTADQLLAALTDLALGDSFEFYIQMVNAHTETLTLGTGITATGTVTIAASSTRKYMLTLLSEPRRTVVLAGSTVNASPIITNLPTGASAQIGIGMGVTGTNVPASTTIIAVNQVNNTATMSANATGTADNTAFTFVPRFDLFGMGAMLS